MSDRTQKPPKGSCLVSCTLVSCLPLITQQVGKNRVEIKAEKWPSPSLPSLAPTVSEPNSAEAGKQPNLMWNSIPDCFRLPEGPGCQEQGHSMVCECWWVRRSSRSLEDKGSVSCVKDRLWERA